MMISDGYFYDKMQEGGKRKETDVYMQINSCDVAYTHANASI